jgi:hypothetical protein
MSEVKFTMVGTTKSGQYVGLAADLGQVGFRNLGSEYRLRIEPADQRAARLLAPMFPTGEWTQPGDGGQFRFSRVIRGESNLSDQLKMALTALLSEGEVRDSSKAPPLMLELLAEIRQANGKPLALQPLGTGPSSCDDRSEPLGTTLSTRVQLEARARALGIKGVNSRWSDAVLRAKINALAPAAEKEEDERHRLIATLRHSKVPGANGASRWTLATLRAKASKLSV